MNNSVKKIVSYVTLFIYMFGLGAEAQIIADPNANQNQRPHIINGANGTPIVNIQTPTQGGISVNHYQQFDIDQKGVILNNSRQPVNTQLGGMVQGNDWLATGSARAIVNQINSQNPSQLNGFIEIAGQKADVIVANPSGININGSGFINAGQVTITTGTPIIQGGHLQRFEIRGGTINIMGNGLNNDGVDYTRVLSEVVNIQAGVWAKDLEVIAGNFDLDMKGEITKYAKKDSQAKVAIDTGALGGMYAGKIKLVSTDKGVGVNNAGTMVATVGGFSLSADGKIVNNGTISSENKKKNDQATVSIKAKQIENKGAISSHGQQKLKAAEITNHGVILSARELIINNGTTLTNTDQAEIRGARLEITSNRLINSGKITQTGTQDLKVEAATLDNTNGGKIGYIAKKLDPNTGAEVPIDHDNNVALPEGSNGSTGAVVNVDNTSPEPNTPIQWANGSINIVEGIDNDGGSISANGGMALKIKESLNNDHGFIAVDDLALSGQNFIHKQGEMNLGTLSVNGQQMINDGGKIQVQKTIDVNVQNLQNINQAKLIAGGHIVVTADYVENDANSTIASDGSIQLTTSNLVNHRDSEIFAKGIEIAAAKVDNVKGSLTSTDQLTITANHLDNELGKIQSNRDLSVSARNEINNQSGLIATGQKLTLSTSDLHNNQGKINAGDVSIHSATVNNQQGEIGSHNALTIKATSIDNQQGKVIAQSVLLDSAQIDNRQKGQVLAEHGLQIVGSHLNNSTGIVSAKALDLAISTILNHQGEMSANDNIQIVGQTLENNQGIIASNQNLSIQNTFTNNTEGKLLSNGQMTLEAKNLTNQQGLIEAKDLYFTGQSVDNRSGKIHGNEQVQLVIDQNLNNHSGEITSAHDLSIASKAGTQDLSMNIESGEILAGNNLSIKAHTLAGKGLLASGKDFVLNLVEDIVTNSTIQAGKDLTIQTQGNIINSGEILAVSGLSMTANDIRNAVSGTIEANQKVVLTVDHNLTNYGLINSNGLTHLAAKGNIYNIGTGKIYGDDIAIQATELHNLHQLDGTQKVSATIAARESLNIGVNYLLNEEGSLLFSGNTLVIGGALNDDLQVINRANLVENKSATIESLGNMAVNANKLVNSNEHFAFKDVEISRENLVWIRPEGSSENYDVSLFRWENWSRAGRYRWATSKPITAAGTPGKTLLVEVNGAYCQDIEDPATCSSIPGSEYLSDNPAWAYFGITPPEDEPEKHTVAEPTKHNLSKPVEPNSSDYNCDAAQACAEYDAAMAEYQVDLDAYETAEQKYQTELKKYSEAETAYIAALEKWYEDNDHLYEQLDDEIQKYNQKFAGKNGGEVRNYTKYQITRTVKEDRIIETDSGKIIAGGHLKLNGGEFINDKSTIIASGNIVGDLANLKNLDQKGMLTTHDLGVYEYTYSKWRGGRKRYHQRKYNGMRIYDETAEQEIDLKAFTVKEYARIDGHNLGDIKDVSNIIVTDAGNSNFTGHSVADAHNKNSLYRNDQNIVIAHVDANTRLPNSSIYIISPNSTKYLIETDPKFTNYKQWLGSDYMLKMLSTNPENMHKRLGDGFYEQRLVNEQINQLTGHRRLAGYSNDEEQLKALMDNSIAFAKGLNIMPGVRLSPEQIARLTNDIVWLENETVTLADGSRVDVLVPKVYLAMDQQKINQSGSLIAGQSIDLNVSGDLLNQGKVAGRDIVSLQANNIQNLSGTVSGNRVGLTAQEDIVIQGGSVLADTQLSLKAGHDVTIESTLYETQSASNSRTDIKRGAGLYVQNAEGTLSVQSGNDINVKAAHIVNAGENGKTQLIAGGDINIGVVTTNVTESTRQDDKNYLHDSRTKDIGSNIATQGDLLVKADNTINIVGSDLNSESGKVTLSGDQGINIREGRETLDFAEGHYNKDKGTLGSSSREVAYADQNDTSISSNITGKEIVMLSKEDINIQGSQVIADQNVTLDAGQNINITASEDSYYHDQREIKKKSGLMSSGGIGFTIGSVKESTEQDKTDVAHTGSTVGSLKGNTVIQAGNSYTQKGSAVASPEGDILIKAKDVNILAVEDTYDTNYRYTREQKGLTVAINVPIVTAIQSVADSIKTVGKSKNSRVNAMAAANTAWDAKKAMDAVGDIGKALDSNTPNPTNISASITYGQSKSESTSHTEGSNAVESSVNAGGKVVIQATGAGENSNINIVGSDVAGKGGTFLVADNQVNIVAAEEYGQERSQNKSSGWNAGVKVSYGSNGFAFGVTAGGNKGKGHGNGDDTTYRYSHVGDLNSQTVIQSGGATNIIGGQVYGKGVKIDADELNVVSLQDKSTYDSKQQNISGSVTVGYGFSGEANFNKSKVKSDYLSANEQSGIYAGDDGFNINVNNNTNLVGGIITSTEKAEADGKNSFTTGTLTSFDLLNQSNYSASGVGIGVSGSIKGQGDGKLMKTESTGMSKSVGYGKDKGSESSTTNSGIYTNNITITDADKQQQLTGKTVEQTIADIKTNIDTDAALDYQGLNNIFDRDKVQKEIDLQVSVTQAFDKNRQEMKLEINQKIDDAKNNPAEKAKWELVGKILDSVSAGLYAPTESIGGSLVAAASPELANQIGQYFKGKMVDGKLSTGDNIAHKLAHGILGAAVAAATGQDVTNGALAGASAEILGEAVTKWLYPNVDDPSTLTPEQKNLVSSIVGLGTAGLGLATGNGTTDVATGGMIGQNAVENNHLGSGLNILGWQIGDNQVEQFAKEVDEACSISQEACDAAKEKWLEISIKQADLSKADLELWNQQLDAAFEKVYEQCKGDESCKAYIDHYKEIAKITDFGVNGHNITGIAENLKHLVDKKQGNYGTLALDFLGDFGDFLPAVKIKLVDKGVEKVVELGGELFAKVKGAWTKVPVATSKYRLNELAVANPNHPLLKDSIPREGGRIVLTQTGPTCGPNSCGMILNTLGEQVDVGKIIQGTKINSSGMDFNRIPNVLKTSGVESTIYRNSSIEDIIKYTSDGTPIIGRIAFNGQGGHAIVIDGITTRGGIQVVAIRDPWGVEYFSPVDTFKKSFSGHLVVPKKTK